MCYRYQAQLPAEYRNQCVGEAAGMAIHESQSLFVEMQLCRSREFFEWAVPHMKATIFSGKPQAAQLTPDSFLPLYRTVEPGFIRVVADEVTYVSCRLLVYSWSRPRVQTRVSDRPSLLVVLVCLLVVSVQLSLACDPPLSVGA